MTDNWVTVSEHSTRDMAEAEREKLLTTTHGVALRISRRVDDGGRIIGWRLECERRGKVQ